MCGMEELPVIYQDFDSEDQEYAFAVSENAISTWAELDFAKINLDIVDIGPDFNINLLGLKGFEIDPSEKETKPEQKEELKTCPHCGEEL